MRKKLKKIMSFVLSIAMIITMFPVSFVSAADKSPSMPKQIIQEEFIDRDREILFNNETVKEKMLERYGFEKDGIIKYSELEAKNISYDDFMKEMSELEKEDYELRKIEYNSSKAAMRAMIYQDDEIVYIPDESVKSALVNNWDTNYDGELSVTEMSTVSGRVNFSSVKDMSGLEYLGSGVTALTIYVSFSFEGFPRGIFDNLVNLDELRISGYSKKIITLRSDIFAYLSKLERLEIRYLNLEKLPNNLFKNLKNLKYVDISGNNLDSFPDELFEKKDLWGLYIGGNQFKYSDLSEDFLNKFPELVSLDINTMLSDTGVVPNEILNCSRLIELDLSNNNITITDNMFEKLINLTDLYLWNNQIVTIGENTFNGLTDLFNLDLSDNQITTIEANAFNELTDLFNLDLSNNQITTIEANAFVGLTKLRYLRLGNNQITSVNANTFNRLTDLFSLNLSNNQIAAIEASTFSEFTSLRTLDLYNNQIISIESNIFAGLTNLTSLNLRCNQIVTIQPNTFTELTNLTSLNLDENKIVTIESNIFAGLTNLTSLNLRRNQIVTIEPNTFTELTNLTSLNLDENKIVAIEPNTFTELTNLTSLNLIGNQITSINANVFNGLNNLRNLELESNQITSINANIFSGLTNLRILDLHNNQIEIIEASAFNGLGSLITLDLNDNQIATIEANVFNELINLWNLDLGGNVITEVPKDALSKLTDLCTLDIQKNRMLYIPSKSFEQLKNLENLYIDGPYLNDMADDAFYGLENLRELWIDHSYLSRYPKLSLSGLSELRILRICSPYIDSIEDGTFTGMTKLKELWLNYNNFTEIPSALLEIGSSLRILNIEGNQIEKINKDDFKGLPNLAYLNLSFANITSIDDDSFASNIKLRDLILSNNSLTTLTKNTFNGPGSLRKLELSNNQLSNVAVDTFNGGNGALYLEYLYLDNNFIPITDAADPMFVGLDYLIRLGISNNVEKPKYTVTAEAKGEGITGSINGSVSPLSQEVYEGKGAKIKVIPTRGYEVLSVKDQNGNDLKKNADGTYELENIIAASHVTAIFSDTELPSFTITATATTGGAISPESGVYYLGENVDFLVTSFDGYEILSVVDMNNSNLEHIGKAPSTKDHIYRLNNITTGNAITASFVKSVVPDDYNPIVVQKPKSDEEKYKEQVDAALKQFVKDEASEQKNIEFVKKIESIITESSKIKITPSNGKIIVSEKATADGYKKLNTMLNYSKKTLADNNVDINKDINAKLLIETGKIQDSLMISFYTDIKTLKEADLLIVNSDKVSISFDPVKVTDLAENNNIDMTITKTENDISSSAIKENKYVGSNDIINKLPLTSKYDESYDIQFYKENKAFDEIDDKITIGFNPNTLDADYNCIMKVEGENYIPVGGRYNASTNKLEAQTNKSGKYMVIENKKSFDDIKDIDAEAKKAIEVLAAKGIIMGKTYNNFDPEASLTRAELTSLVAKLLYLEAKNVNHNFKDVNKGTWYTPFVEASFSAGIINGYPDKTFRPENNILNQEVISIIAKTLQTEQGYRIPKDITVYLKSLNANDISEWLAPYAALAEREGLLIKSEKNEIKTEQDLTRREAAIMLYRLFKLL